MTDIDSLLAAWWRWSREPENGWYSVNFSCRPYRASRQRDDENGALDTDFLMRMIIAVDHEIDRLEQPYRMAVELHACNLCIGARVMIPARLADREERERVTAAGVRAVAAALGM